MMALFGKGLVRTPKLLLSYCERRGRMGKLSSPSSKQLPWLLSSFSSPAVPLILTVAVTTAATVLVCTWFPSQVPTAHEAHNFPNVAYHKHQRL